MLTCSPTERVEGAKHCLLGGKLRPHRSHIHLSRGRLQFFTDVVPIVVPSVTSRLLLLADVLWRFVCDIVALLLLRHAVPVAGVSGKRVLGKTCLR